MQPFPNLSSATRFPYPESDWLEFKRDVCRVQSMKDKQRILCAFLNSGGGYLVIGVIDTELTICGVDESVLDTFALQVDDIYHKQTIIHEDDSSMLPGVIRVKGMYCKDNKFILVVTCLPTPGKKYKCSDGEVYYRLSASNYKFTSGQMSLSDVDIRGLIDKKLLQAKKDIRKAKEDYDDLLQITRSHVKECSQLRSRVIELEITLERIKEEEEKKVQKESDSLWMYLFGNCFKHFSI